LEKLYKSAIKERTKILSASHQKTVDSIFALGKLYVEERLDELDPFVRQFFDWYYH